ncbi:5,6-dimethylbenzimidazole synthase [Sphingobium terrigena]|uniref:5,6-dimethylbenzimidazole synthase n=1 Tax=Sphingobium terrigena TaxID=2304063 RepID=A0A418YVD1_9SPHN|nr:5,6-dimethylbenzimidazole synthase [Sphingobium terrigena]RJG56185.1 5,6-dimethylbenzimidazole synthase [Sphingobium terrigena]
MNAAPPRFDAAFAAQLDMLLRWRRDVRHFRPDPVAPADMDGLLAATALAPSVGNAQPWRFVRIASSTLRQALADHVDTEVARAAERYVGTDREARYRALKLHAVAQAPELMAVYCDEAPCAGHGLGIATMPEMLRYSTVMAIHTLWLAARARGIGMGWVSILDPVQVNVMLDVPAPWSLIALLCIGYPSDDSATPELEQRDWQAREPWRDRIVTR